jgi:hypothetical protein
VESCIIPAPVCALYFLTDNMILADGNLYFLIFFRNDILCKAAYASLKQNTTITANECKKCDHYDCLGQFSLAYKLIKICSFFRV